MTSIASSKSLSTQAITESNTMSLLGQLLMMTRRSLMVLFRIPDAIIPSLFISVFFLLIYEASLGGITEFPGPLQGVDYLAFTLPVAIFSAALNSPAGQAMVRDIESGYFDKLLLTPINRGALLLGHIISSGFVVLLQTIIIMILAMFLGLKPETGLAGVVVILGFSVMIGIGFGGFTVAIALRTGNAAATQGASFIFFPLIFLSTTYLPLEALDGWFKVVAQLNPITYILDASRELLIYGWDSTELLNGLLGALVLSVFPFMFALFSLQARTRRK